MSNSEQLFIKSVECGICDKSFSGGVAEIAKSVARHWNDEHGDELAVSETPYKIEEYQGHHLHGDEYSYRVKEYYITAYDVLDTSGASCGPFAYAYVKEPEAKDHCEDCWRPIGSVDGYQELDTDGWRDKYLCDECARERKIERRKANNKPITEWSA